MAEIGVDYGKARTGFALHMSGVVLPLEPMLNTTWEGIRERLESIHGESGRGTVVLGLPLSASGRPTQLSREVEGLAEFLRERGFSVDLVVETGSTAEAGRNTATGDRRDGRLDSMAAMIILKRYLGIP
ncbi:MAG: RuvX/YqgF family protein [Candidatus Aegiribacteria sp.]